MPDPDSLPPPPAVTPRGSYAIAGGPAIPSLAAKLREEIGKRGTLPFDEFMAVALYDPELGYYARSARQVGRSGDFFTSVSVGPLFGELLARRFIRCWVDLGRPKQWRILECGAHDGTLAADVLGAISRNDSQAYSSVEYAIPEPLPVLQAAQRATLAGLPVRFVHHADELAADPLPGIAFGNELLDALPFHIVEWRCRQWHLCGVACDAAGEFIWESNGEITDPRLADALSKLSIHFPDGYRTEVRTNYQEFLRSLTGCLTSGILIWTDYGFARPEYYDPLRANGTLRTFSKHRAAEDPLLDPGEIDITAHVDFTAVAEAGIDVGCIPTEFRNQGSWLTEIGREWLLAQEGQPDPAALRQFQTLTHPAHLGGHFHVIELAWNQPHSTVSPDLSHRLALQACPRPTDG